MLIKKNLNVLFVIVIFINYVVIIIFNELSLMTVIQRIVLQVHTGWNDEIKTDLLI